MMGDAGDSSSCRLPSTEGEFFVHVIQAYLTGHPVDEAAYKQHASAFTSTNGELSRSHSNIVHFDGDDDPLDPQNWSIKKKYILQYFLRQ